MFEYPYFNPVIGTVGPLEVTWYGAMYVLGFWLGWIFLRHRAPRFGWTETDLVNLAIVTAAGVLLGGRIGYLIFYAPGELISSPFSIIQLHRPGRSFHGGLLGVVVAIYFYARRSTHTISDILDFLTPAVPIGLGLGRIGNFINSEIWGKTTDVPWGFVVYGETRHATQLYHFFLEGVVLFVILAIVSARRPSRLTVSGLFLCLYGVFRIIVEFFRLPDPRIGYLAFDWLTVGHVLSVPMLLGGAIMIWYARRQAEC